MFKKGDYVVIKTQPWYGQMRVVWFSKDDERMTVAGYDDNGNVVLTTPKVSDVVDSHSYYDWIKSLHCPVNDKGVNQPRITHTVLGDANDHI